MNTPSHLLSMHPFWEGLAPQHFLSLEECATLQHFRPHEKIFEKGHEADHFYLILSGEVSIETPFLPGEGVVQVQSICAGEALGWSWLYPPYEWHFTVRAVQPTEAIKLNAVKLRQNMKDNPAFGYEVAMRVGNMLSERLNNTRARLLGLCEV